MRLPFHVHANMLLHIFHLYPPLCKSRSFRLARSFGKYLRLQRTVHTKAWTLLNKLIYIFLFKSLSRNVRNALFLLTPYLGMCVVFDTACICCTSGPSINFSCYWEYSSLWLICIAFSSVNFPPSFMSISRTVDEDGCAKHNPIHDHFIRVYIITILHIKFETCRKLFSDVIFLDDNIIKLIKSKHRV